MRKSPRQLRQDGALAFELGESANPHEATSISRAVDRAHWQQGYDDAKREHEQRIERENRERPFSVLQSADVFGDADNVTMLDLCRAILALHERVKKLEGVE